MQSQEWNLKPERGGVAPEIPDLPGVYHFFDASGALIYVGKAKSLRRRLAQYRETKSRKKKHRRVKRIVTAARRVRIFVETSHLDACLREVRDIQALKPTLNVSSAFCFRYPFLGVQRLDREIRFGFTTKREELEGFELHGAFRSRETSAEAFFALMRLLTMLGHRSKLAKKDRPKSRYTYIHAFRLLPEGYESEWSSFFNGASRKPLEDLVMRLLDHVGARSRSSETQDDVNAIRRFWDGESRPLAKAIADAAYEGPYPVAQGDRDLLFLRAKLRDEE